MSEEVKVRCWASAAALCFFCGAELLLVQDSAIELLLKALARGQGHWGQGLAPTNSSQQANPDQTGDKVP